MDIRSFIRPIIAGLVGLGIVVLIIVLIVKAFSGGNGPAAPSIDLGKYQTTAATATLLIDSQTNLDQDHRQVRITVNQSQSEIDVIQGYQGNVMKTQSYANNSDAFGTFLQSLKLLNFAKGNGDKAAADYRGYCPTGERYVYTFNDGSKNLFTYWSTSCRQGTFKGNAAGVLSLFRAQIPQHDYNTLTGAIPLGF